MECSVIFPLLSRVATVTIVAVEWRPRRSVPSTQNVLGRSPAEFGQSDQVPAENIHGSTWITWAEGFGSKFPMDSVGCGGGATLETQRREPVMMFLDRERS